MASQKRLASREGSEEQRQPANLEPLKNQQPHVVSKPQTRQLCKARPIGAKRLERGNKLIFCSICKNSNCNPAADWLGRHRLMHKNHNLTHRQNGTVLQRFVGGTWCPLVLPISLKSIILHLYLVLLACGRLLLCSLHCLVYSSNGIVWFPVFRSHPLMAGVYQTLLRAHLPFRDHSTCGVRGSG